MGSGPPAFCELHFGSARIVASILAHVDDERMIPQAAQIGLAVGGARNRRSSLRDGGNRQKRQGERGD